MSEIVCSNCGAEVPEGGFCSRCGASLETRECPSCGSEARPGDRFCTSCGGSLAADVKSRPTGSGGGSGNSRLGWWVAGLAMVAVILFMLVPVLQPDRGLQDGEAAPGAPATGGGPAGGGPAGGDLGPAPNVDLGSMTPREAADRLFDRVMRAAAAGDSSEVQQFLPMALGAYERARPLDADGLFHLSALQRTALEHEAARETALSGLEDEPDHLLLLAEAAEAARQLGDTAAARRHYEHLLEVWEEERAGGREEYEAHSALLPRIREDAEAFLDGG